MVELLVVAVELVELVWGVPACVALVVAVAEAEVAAFAVVEADFVSRIPFVVVAVVVAAVDAVFVYFLLQ